MSPNEWGQENELHMRTWQLSKKDLQGNKYLNGVQKVWEPHSVLIHYQWTVTWYWNLVEWKHFLYRLMQTDTNVLLLPWLMQLRESNTFNSINCNFMIKGLQIRSARCLCCFMVKVHKEHSEGGCIVFVWHSLLNMCHCGEYDTIWTSWLATKSLWFLHRQKFTTAREMERVESWALVNQVWLVLLVSL